MLGGRWARPLQGLIARERDVFKAPGGEILIDPSGEVTPLPPRPWPEADSPLGLLAPGDALRVADAHTGLRSTWPISPEADPAEIGAAIGARLISEGAEPDAGGQGAEAGGPLEAGLRRPGGDPPGGRSKQRPGRPIRRGGARGPQAVPVRPPGGRALGARAGARISGGGMIPPYPIRRKGVHTPAPPACASAPRMTCELHARHVRMTCA